MVQNLKWVEYVVCLSPPLFLATQVLVSYQKANKVNRDFMYVQAMSINIPFT